MQGKEGWIPSSAADVSHFLVLRRNLCKSPKFTASLSYLALDYQKFAEGER